MKRPYYSAYHRRVMIDNDTLIGDLMLLDIAWKKLLVSTEKSNLAKLCHLFMSKLKTLPLKCFL